MHTYLGSLNTDEHLHTNGPRSKKQREGQCLQLESMERTVSQYGQACKFFTILQTRHYVKLWMSGTFGYYFLLVTNLLYVLLTHINRFQLPLFLKNARILLSLASLLGCSISNLCSAGQIWSTTQIHPALARAQLGRWNLLSNLLCTRHGMVFKICIFSTVLSKWKALYILQ